MVAEEEMVKMERRKADFMSPTGSLSHADYLHRVPLRRLVSPTSFDANLSASCTTKHVYICVR